MQIFCVLLETQQQQTINSTTMISHETRKKKIKPNIQFLGFINLFLLMIYITIQRLQAILSLNMHHAVVIHV